MKAPHQAGLTFQTDGSFGFFASPSGNNVPGGNIWTLSPGALWALSLRCRTETEDAPIRGRPLWHMMHRRPPIGDTEVKIRLFNMQCEICWRFDCMIGDRLHRVSFFGALNTLWLIVLRGPARGLISASLCRQCNEFPPERRRVKWNYLEDTECQTHSHTCTRTNSSVHPQQRESLGSEWRVVCPTLLEMSESLAKEGKGEGGGAGGWGVSRQLPQSLAQFRHSCHSKKAGGDNVIFNQLPADTCWGERRVVTYDGAPVSRPAVPQVHRQPCSSAVSKMLLLC